MDVTAVLALHIATDLLPCHVFQPLQRLSCFFLLDLNFYFMLFSFMLFIQRVLSQQQSRNHPLL